MMTERAITQPFRADPILSHFTSDSDYLSIPPEYQLRVPLGACALLGTTLLAL